MNERTDFATRQREFDYIQLRWLEKTTGRPSHEWDVYILKELLDNALDADERWARAGGGAVEIEVELNYSGREAATGVYNLDITVSGRAPFPTARLSSIFDLTAYASDKSHYRYPTRGQQGNALKTILGIPYALRREFYGDYQNYRKPLVIESGELSYLISLDIEERGQEVVLRPPEVSPRRGATDKTRIRVGIDRFVQESPRSSTDIHSWARRYAILNPHATFRWSVSNGGEKEQWEFNGDPSWGGLFSDTAPVHWYEYTQLRELLLAMERERGPDAGLADALQAFSGFTTSEDPGGRRALALCDGLGLRTLGDLRLADGHDQTLRKGVLPALTRAGRKVPAERLGGLGAESVAGGLSSFSLLQGGLLYRRLVRDSCEDPAHPFVLEVALARLPDRDRRVIWTGLNHTPTYEDPFYTRQLSLPGGHAEPVLGLDGFLDAYGVGADQPVLLLMHIICPNLAFQDFSKTLIDTRPFREPLVETLHDLLTEYRSVQTTMLEDLQPLAHALIPRAADLLSHGGRVRYSGSQLLHALRRLLTQQLRHEGRGELLQKWLNERGANARLQGYIQSYVREHPSALADLIKIERGRLALPMRPAGHINLPLSKVGQGDVDQACVNKILLVTDPELVSVVIFNGLLTRFDAAILHLDDSFESSFEALLPHLRRLPLPLALLHHATANDCLTAERLRARLAESHLGDIPLYDLGLTPSQGWRLNLIGEPGPSAGDHDALGQLLGADEVAFLIDEQQQISLFSLMPDMLADWLGERFSALNLSPKLIPAEAQVRATLLSLVRSAVAEWARKSVDEIMRPDLLADQAMALIIRHFNPSEGSLGLEDAVRQQPFKSWRMVLSETIATRCQAALAAEAEQVTPLLRGHRPGPNAGR